MNRIQMAICAIALGTAFPATAPAEWDAVTAAGQLASSGEIHLRMYNEERADGFMRLGWYREGNDLVLYDRTMMLSGEVYETMQARMSALDFTPSSVLIRFHQGTGVLNINVAFENGQASGLRVVERPGRESEAREMRVSVQPGTLLRALTFVLPLVLDPAPGQEISYPWLAPLGGEVATVTLSSSDGGEIETPAGTFDTTLWQLRGGTPENDIYVSRGENPRIVRIDVLEQPLRFLAVD